MSGGGGLFASGGSILGRHRIEHYGAGGFRFADMSHEGSILVSPAGVRALDLKSFAALDAATFSALLSELGGADLLILGTGAGLLPLPASFRAVLRSQDVGAETMATSAAVRTYNLLFEEGRRVAALLIAV